MLHSNDNNSPYLDAISTYPAEYEEHQLELNREIAMMESNQTCGFCGNHTAISLVPSDYQEWFDGDYQSGTIPICKSCVESEEQSVMTEIWENIIGFYTWESDYDQANCDNFILNYEECCHNV